LGRISGNGEQLMIQNNSIQYFQRNFGYLIFLILTLTGCVANTVKELAWPEDLPPRVYFLGKYKQDSANKNIEKEEEYLNWVIRFYKGWTLYPNGWNNITKDLLAKLKDQKTANAVKIKMGRLGLLISSEWAKNNKTRLISSRHVSVWGNALMKSLDCGDTLQLIDRVAKDIDGLLGHKIPDDAITAQRYYADDEEIAF
jgi:hypothetical protein